MKFDAFDLHEDILKGVEKAGFSECLPVQEKTFAEALGNNKDVCVQSQTGTGKTAAFLIPIFQLLLTHDFFKGKKALVVAPTRELAVQIEKEARILASFLDLKIGCFFGGMGYAQQEKNLQQGVDLIIGTPGRLIDFSQQKKLDFKQVGIMVIDEADRLFDMGFLPDIRRIFKKMPSYKKRRTMLFSATLDYRVKELAWEHMNQPVEIELTPEQIFVENVVQELYHVGQEEKMPLLLGILKKEDPANALIFTNTKHMAYEVAKRLSYNGYPCEYIMGDLPQKKRLSIIEGVKSGKFKYLVATEVAARGLHIEDLDLVLNYDLPTDSESYVHRIGRTARVGKTGKAISFACEKFVYGLEAIESFIDQKIPVIWADEDLFVADKSASKRFHMQRDEKGGRPFKKSTPEKKRSAPTPGPKKRPRPKKGGRPSQEKTQKKSSPRGNGKKAARPDRKTAPSRKSNVEDRVEYYKEKYGDDFVIKARTQPNTGPSAHIKKKKKSLLARFSGVFGSSKKSS